jgi:hypothetical protein
MGQFSAEKPVPPGSALSGNQHREHLTFPAAPVSPALPMRAVPGGERGGWRNQAMSG